MSRPRNPVRRTITLAGVYERIATELRENGYPDASAQMIAETHSVMKSGEPIPHGIVGMFAQWQLAEVAELLAGLQ